MPMDRKSPLEIGSTFLVKYRIDELIGRGGQAWVYRAHDTFMQRDFAIKIIDPGRGMTPEMRARARNEARVTMGLKHRYIVDVQDAGPTDDGWIYIRMELLHGRG